MERTYIAIDLKSFYASVECVERHFDPLTTNLVVADSSRTEKTICLAVSPSLKAHGIPGRARLFEVVQRVREVNAKRLSAAVRSGHAHRGEDGNYHFLSSSFDAPTLEKDPSLELAYYVAPPRMRLYEEYSTKIYSIYLKYIAPEDIHVYSIDEVFIDATHYLKTYRLSPHELAMSMIREVLYTTGITATAGIGTNLYLAKVAMDIVAKHVPSDKDGVRIAELDEKKYRELLWCHRPLTDFWRVGRGYRTKLERLGLYTMGDIARFSAYPKGEEILYKTFGINAELLIDHAWGWEPTTIAYIKAYRPSTNSLSSGQVLKEPYDYEKSRLIVKEMTELLVLELVKKHLVTGQITLTIGYDRERLVFEYLFVPVLGKQVQGMREQFQGPFQFVVLPVHDPGLGVALPGSQHNPEMVGKLFQRRLIFADDPADILSRHSLKPFRLRVCVTAVHGKADQRIHRYVEDLGEVHDVRKVRLRGSAFPLGNRCQRDAEPLRQLLLSESHTLPEAADILSQVVFHTFPPAVFRPVLIS